MKKFDDEVFKNVVKNSDSMSAAAAKLGLHFNTFKRLALKFEIYKPNQGGKGTKKPKPQKIFTDDILNGNHPQFQTFKLKQRLLKEGIKENVCDKCGISEWEGQTLQCELHHIDGDRTNHKLENLQIICPNCHSLTDTFRAKNIK